MLVLVVLVCNICVYNDATDKKPKVEKKKTTIKRL